MSCMKHCAGENGEKRRTERLDDILWLCCRLVRCGPGDAVLHVTLLAIGKVSVPSDCLPVQVATTSIPLAIQPTCYPIIRYTYLVGV